MQTLKRYTVSLVLALFCLSVSAVTLAEAKALVTAGDYQRASVAFRSLLEQKAMVNNAGVNKLYGQCLCMLGEYEEAIPYLEKGAKGRQNGALWYLGICKQRLYDFEGAIESLEAYKSSFKSKTTNWIERSDSIIAECEIGSRGLNRVQDVEIIDSLMVPALNFFEHYTLGHESGKLRASFECEGAWRNPEDSSMVVFENLQQDMRLMCLRDSSGYDANLFMSQQFNGLWSAPEKIESLGWEGYDILYPFMRADGMTIYFASNVTPGFGGLDIYRTSFNPETDSYYAPTRLGMPFNSPYNDYMMAIDETNNVGWWATDRGATEGFVCIYIFKLNEEDVEYVEENNESRARIERIADSWKQANYDALIHDVRHANDPIVVQHKLFIPIREGVVYTSADEFKNPEARSAYELLVSEQENLAENEAELEQLRHNYGNANLSAKQSMRTTILQKESLVNELRERVKTLEKKYRNLEN